MADSKAKLVVFQRADDKWAWRLRGDNGNDIVATDGGQGYENQADATKMGKQVISGHYKDATVLAVPKKKA